MKHIWNEDAYTNTKHSHMINFIKNDKLIYLKIGKYSLYYLKFASSLKIFLVFLAFCSFRSILRWERKQWIKHYFTGVFTIVLDITFGSALGRLPLLHMGVIQKKAVIILCIHSLLWRLIILGNCIKQYVSIKLNVISRA